VRRIEYLTGEQTYLSDDMTFTIIAAVIILFLIGNYSQSWFKRAGRIRKRKMPDPRFHNSKLVSVLLELNDEAIRELLDLYKKEFGRGPARYAKTTYQRWKAGQVQPSMQTFQRFLVHLPKVMTYDLKCEILRHFMLEYVAKDKYELSVYTDNWEEKVTPLVEQIIEKIYTAQLPVEVERKLKWLGDGDMQTARAILKASQAEESRTVTSMLGREFEIIENLLREKNLSPKVTHVTKFPYGTINLKIKRRRSNYE
jgi:hypothetical protein